MKNMGLSRLRMVSPFPLDETLLRARTVHAEDVWGQALFLIPLPKPLLTVRCW